MNANSCCVNKSHAKEIWLVGRYGTEKSLRSLDLDYVWSAKAVGDSQQAYCSFLISLAAIQPCKLWLNDMHWSRFSRIQILMSLEKKNSSDVDIFYVTRRKPLHLDCCDEGVEKAGNPRLRSRAAYLK